ncbi:phosphoribosyl-AMP cyclohydrolase [Rhizobium sp. TRM95796]|uniref:phosphoribosyl-AMP cyclohydrolase n=1 Tax=Rhizobium sp. TRM95796 TaxID=2979862 RepID=UPI0021E7D385|nr:phosphoribosyl-AMP cyclohydrolase [Rhizobium sp. TRM95796]MCV3764201.1 phosphoribosyl-AMP cyclohydrolase [Rhizobium sp. TRM95796]
MTIAFDPPPADKASLEEGVSFTPKFDQNGLITAIVTDHRNNALLMVGHMNAEALALTLETGVVHYFSRSRGKLWKKGETSGNLQHVVEILTDCDQDALQVKVKVGGHDATCHTGRRSCFYRAVTLKGGAPVLDTVDDHRHFEPDSVYQR